MKTPDKKNAGMDWALAASILFWIVVVASFATLISIGRTAIPRSDLEITEASGGRGNLLLVHQGGDPIWLANTRCTWTPDISNSSVTEKGGSLILAGKEREHGH